MLAVYVGISLLYEVGKCALEWKALSSTDSGSDGSGKMHLTKKSGLPNDR